MAKDHDDAQARMGITIRIHIRGPHPQSEIVKVGANMLPPFDGPANELGDPIVSMGLPADKNTARLLRQIAQLIDERRLFGWAQDEIASGQIELGEWDPIDGDHTP